MIVQESSEFENAEAAPLMIALPGMFGNFRNRGARRLLQAFASRGYHVVVPSNPWSRRFIRDQPDFHTGDILAEANFVRELIAFAVREIGEEKHFFYLASGRKLRLSASGHRIHSRPTQ